MQEDFKIFIPVSIVGLILGIAYLYVYFKDQKRNPYFAISSFLWFLMPLFMITGTILTSEKLIVAAFTLPLTMFLFATALELMARYKKCTYAVSAKCVSFTARGKGRYYSPEFSYSYNGENFSVCSFTSYTRRKFKKNFVINGTYKVHIDPNDPKQCVDKRFYPTGNIFVLILSALFFLFFAVVVIFI